VDRNVKIAVREGWLPRLDCIHHTVDHLIGRDISAEEYNDLHPISLKEEDCRTSDDWEVLFLLHVMVDLSFHGWDFNIETDEAIVGYCETQHDVEKEITRLRHTRERDQQLLEPSVQRFIKGMEAVKRTDVGMHSVFSLMRDGGDLAALLHLSLDDEGALADAVQPYIQFVEANVKCSHTGLLLPDIWRYFRHTWSTTYKPVPGRSINILIRDAAAPNHSVIGIAALGSSIVQQASRDEWIGWTPDQIIDEIADKGTKSTASWLLESLQRQIEAIRVDDLIAEGRISQLDIDYPRTTVIQSLIEFADVERRKHKQTSSSRSINPDWATESGTWLYRSKRASTLAGLMSARNVLQEAAFSTLSANRLRDRVRKPSVRKAVSAIVRGIRAEHVGVNMMDITVCGAIPPYSHLLGGKLVCLMLMSPEIVAYYNTKYANHESVIASSLRGEPVMRKPKLALLCTTSLYAARSSQYNRVKLPLDEVVTDRKGEMKYEKLGLSLGFGTFHISSMTMGVMNGYLKSLGLDQEVKNIFGEGVNPLLRKLRLAIDAAGLPADQLLNHQSRRIVYGIPLAKNFRKLLAGKNDNAQYYLPTSNSERSSRKIADYWRRRWLASRSKNSTVMRKVMLETLSHPVDHGARVKLYELIDDANFEFEF
jgi:hypothetical protein